MVSNPTNNKLLFIIIFIFNLLINTKICYAEVIALTKEYSFGSAFLVDQKGYIVTANHVLKNKNFILAGPFSGNKWKKALLVKYDEKNDLALLKIPPTEIQPLEIADWTEIPIGIEVYAIGYPIPKILGLSRKITQGLLNGFRTDVDAQKLFQFSASIQKGNSGGPVLSSNGLVIGVVQKKLDTLKIAERSKDLPESVNYALNSGVLLEFLQDTPVNPLIKKNNLTFNIRPYEIYLQKKEAVMAVISRGDVISKGDINNKVESIVPELAE